MIPLLINQKDTNYLIDEQGNIFNIKTNKFLKGSIKHGYRSVKLTVNGVKKDYLVHRLVAETFLMNSDNLPQVNHKDGNKLNNDISNLEWISASDNIAHSWQVLKRKKRQTLQPLDENVEDNEDWVQYLNTNYYVCKDGRCANIKTKKYLNSVETSSGYLQYSLYINQQTINILVHILVFKAFYPERAIQVNEQINHKDGNKKNNHLNNLEKISNSENMYHSYYILKQNTVSVEQHDLEGKLLKVFPSITKAAMSVGGNAGGISQAINGKIKTYKGFIWRRE